MLTTLFSTLPDKYKTLGGEKMAVSIQKVEKWAQKNKVEKLLKALSTEDNKIRLSIIKALSKVKDDSAMYQLTTLLKDSNPDIRTAAVESLGVMGKGRALEFVRQLWSSETNEDVREKARLAIKLIKEHASEENH